MKFLIGSSIVLLLVGCATKKTTTTFKDVDDIKQEDFKGKKQIRYKKTDDYFSSVKSEYTSALNEESLERVFQYDGDVKIEGTLNELTELCYNGKFNEAKNLFKKFSKTYLKNAIYWNQVGTCFLLEGKRRKALLFFNKALSLKSNYAPSLNNLGVMYMKEKDYSRALVAFRRARKSSDFNKTPRFNLANLYLNFGLYDRAITHANVLYGASKTDVDVLNILGTANLMKNEISQAIKYFSLIDSDFLEKPAYGINYALALHLDGKKERAIDAFEDIEKKDQKEWKKYYREVANMIGVKK